jgi:hypothetical protein
MSSLVLTWSILTLHRCLLAAQLSLRHLLPVAELLPPTLPRLKRKRKRKKRSVFEWFTPTPLYLIRFFLFAQEESDDDMGFGLFD